MAFAANKRSVMTLFSGTDMFSHQVRIVLAEKGVTFDICMVDVNNLPEELLGDIQDAFLQGDGDLPSVASIADQFTPQIEEGVLYCVRAALQAEFGESL